MPGREVQGQVLLFGPEITEWSEAQLRNLHANITSNGRLESLVTCLRELPDSLLWHTANEGRADWSTSAATAARRLSDFILGDFSHLSPTSGNAVLAPLTVVEHAIKFIELIGEHNQLDDRAEIVFPPIAATQGFCVGFLSSIAISTSKDWTQLTQNLCKAVRLAVCIGATVDGQSLPETSQSCGATSKSFSVRWKSSSEKAFMDACIRDLPPAYISCVTDEKTVTVTTNPPGAAKMVASLAEQNISCVQIGVRGCFHHERNHVAAQSLKELSENNPDLLQIGNDNSPGTSVRPPLGGSLSSSEEFSSAAAIDLILCIKSDWLETVRTTTSQFPEPDVTLIGRGSFVPRSLTKLLSPKPPFQEAKPESKPYLDNSDPEQADVSGTKDIAIIGVACRYPQATSLEEFWDLIIAGRTALSQIPESRFKRKDVHREPKLEYWGNFLQDVESFDNKFFGNSGREAKSMDPQQRLALQVAYEALECSGYFRKRPDVRDENVGCYIGVGSVDYEHNISSEDANAFAALGTLRAFISGRVSHFFGWSGPSLTLDTACSSSIVAIHSACQALLADECVMALSGGVNVITSPTLYQNLAAANFLSTTGSSKAFDASANGYCRGEGAGILILKRLSRAIADGDTIHGIIAGSGINQGTNRTPITVPDSGSQVSLYKKCLSVARMTTNDITYVEAHGTGTMVGDPIEYRSVQSLFGGPDRQGNLFLGSVKDNIGHCEAASGVAGVIKTLLMMRYGQIPKQANFERLNPKIEVHGDEDKIVIPTKSMPWKSIRRAALVNNYGAAGSNAALILRQYSTIPPISDFRTDTADGQVTAMKVYPIVLSANSMASLQSNAASLLAYLGHTELDPSQDSEWLDTVAHNIAWRQNCTFGFRAAFEVSSKEDLITALNRVTIDTSIVSTPTESAPIVFCFGGQTGLEVSVSEDLYNNTPAFKYHLDQCNDVCQTMGLPALYPDIFNEKPVHDLVKLHCMLFALQYSSANCWMSLGVRPDILIGHSFGHLTALCIAGCISLKDGIRLVSCRARLLQDRLIGDAGCMLALEANRIVVDGLISLVNAEPNLELAIACDNGANSFVVAGNSLSIRKFEELCQQKEPSLKPTRLENSHAYHSHLMDCILPPFNELVGGIEFRSPQIPIETCTTIPISHELDAEHIVHHTRDTVYFGKAVGRISERLGGAIWLEIGSATPITNMIRKTLKSRQPSQSLNDTFIPVDLRRPKVSKSLAGASTKLWTSGLPICHWSFSQKSPKPVILPPYQFEKKKYWLELKPAAAPDKDSGRMSRSPGKLVNLVQRQSTTGELLFDIDTTHPHYHLAVEGHAVGGQGLCPASMYVELVAQCAIYAPGHRTEEQCVPRVRDLHMVSPLGLGAVGVQVKLIKDAPNLNARSWKFIISSQGQERDTRTKEHAMGHFDLRNSTDPTVETEFKLLRQVVRPSRHAQITSSPEALGLTGPMVYKTFSQVVQYASYYQGVANVFGKGDEAAGVVQLCNKTPLELPSGVSAPVLVDNFLQVLGIHANCIADRNHGEVLMCTSIDEMIFSSEFTSGSKNTKDWKVYTRSTTENPQTTVGDIFVFTASTDLLVLALLGVNFRSVQFKSLLRALDRLSMTTRANAHSDKEKPASDSGYQTSVSANSTGASTTAEVSDNDQDPSPSPRVPHQRKSQNIRPDAAAALEKTAEIQMMLMEVLELERQDVKLTFELDALGIDSLMITEVLTEIRKRFNVQISAEEFQELNDVASLCDLINTEIGVGKISRTHVQTHVPIDASISSSLPSVEVKQISLPPTAGDTPVEESYDFAALTQTAFSKVARQFDEFGSDTNLLGFYKNVYPKQSELVVRYVVEAFAQLSCDLASLQSGSSVPLISHISLHEKVIPQLYIILEDAGLISLLVSDDDERTWIRTASPVPETSAATLHQRLLDDSPRHTSETQLLRTTASSLAGCLSGTADALALLFKDAKAKSLLQDVYTNAPMFRTGTLLLARYLSTIIRGLISEDVATDINILELGGGTGGTTAHLLETIASIAGTAGKLKITYTFTDLSSSLVAAAKRRFSSCTFLQFAVLDVEKSPSPEWLSRFDVVLSTNCIHATRNLVTSTSHIRQMLRPHGVLCLIELTRNLFWFDLVFGLLDGWWLFEDGRTHALADEARWEASLRQAGFSWVDWSRGESQESELLRLIVASSTKRQIRTISGSGEVEGFDFDKETLVFKEVDGLQLKADLYYPLKKNTLDNKAYPLALLIHGGGHIMLSRDDIRLAQVKMLLDAGIVPISVDYRLCPEVNLVEGPMVDVLDALRWTRQTLPDVKRRRQDVELDGNTVVTVGWSTGGMLALSLGWTSLAEGVQPPDATLAFYCPTDYEDEHWLRPNKPDGSDSVAADHENYQLNTGTLAAGVFDRPLTAYNVPQGVGALGGWMAPTDPRSRIALYMNWQGKTLDVLLNGLSGDYSVKQQKEAPSPERVVAISPLAQIRTGRYTVPTFIIHPRQDDLIPWQQAQRTYDALQGAGVVSHLRIIEREAHLFDLRLEAGHRLKAEAARAVEDGYQFLADYAH